MENLESGLVSPKLSDGARAIVYFCGGNQTKLFKLSFGSTLSWLGVCSSLQFGVLFLLGF